MGLSLKDYQYLLGDLKGLEIGTLKVEHHDGSGEEEMAYVPGSPKEDPLFCCLRGELREKLTDAIECLLERERMVMTLCYFEELTQRKIGAVLGVDRSRVSQIHASAVVHLRSALQDLSAQGRSGSTLQERNTGAEIN